MAKHIPDWDTDTPGAGLGSLKCECTDEVEKVYKKKAEGVVLPESPADLPAEVRKHVWVKIQMARERDSIVWKPLPFNHPEGTLCNSANKLYALRTRLKSGVELDDLCKAKGMSRGLFTFEDYVAMFDTEDPKPLKDPGQKQFKLPLSAYCRDGGLQPMKLLHLPKEAHARYDKGDRKSVV